MKRTRYETPEKKRIIPLRTKAKALGIAALVFMGHQRLYDDAAIAALKAAGSVTGYDQQNNPGLPPTEDKLVEAEPSISEPFIYPEQSVHETLPPEPEDCLGNTYQGWHFDAGADVVIDSIEGYSVTQKDFLKFAVRGVCQIMRDGAPIAPNVYMQQLSLESNSGTDTLAPYNNFGGHKASEADIASGNFVEVWTTEDFNDGRGKVRVKQKFKIYDTPAEGLEHYVDMIGRLPWYADSVACRHDSGYYAAGLIHELDHDTCQIIRRQGEDGVLSYATDKKYIEALKNRGQRIKVSDYIYPAAP